MSNVTVQYEGDMLFKCTAGNHTLTIDVPKTMGGKDRGETPTELMVSSLAACIAVLVAKYCKDVNIDPTGLSVNVTYDKLENPSRLGNFKVDLKIPAGVGEHKEGVLRAAVRCPVHETLRHHEGIELRLV